LLAVAEVANEREAELAMPAHALDHRTRQLTAPGDEHAIEPFARPVSALDHRAHDSATENHEHRRANKKDQQRGTGIENVLVSRPHPQQHSGKNDRGYD